MQATDPFPAAPQSAASTAATPILDDGNLASWLRLAHTPGVGAVAAAALLAQSHTPERIFQADAATLAALLADCLPAARVPAAVHALRQPSPALMAQVACQREVLAAWRTQPGQAVLTCDDPGYPPQLLAISDPPLLLYIKGNAALLARPSLAMVGSRKASMQGMRNAEHLAAALSQAGLSIVSGLALGIDAAAHRGGLQGDASTIAVIGTGVDRVYPAANLELFERIAQHGCIVSEFPLGTVARPENFPMRNRIISGLARGVLVVEAAEKSGSLITTRFALDQGRDVFAVPGSIHAPLAKGCHRLLRQGATLVECADDVLEVLLPGAVPPKQKPGPDRAARAEAVRGEMAVLLVALGHDPAAAGALAERAGMPLADTQGYLLALELAGLVERLPGGIFQRLPG